MTLHGSYSVALKGLLIALLCYLMLFTIGCKSNPFKPNIPEKAFEPTPHASPEPNTARGLATWLSNEQQQLKMCNADKVYICIAGGYCKEAK